MSNLIDDEEIDLGVRRHSDDKLTYKLIIANAINECRRCEGLIKEYPDSVNAFINLLSFDVKGYNLKEQIDAIVERLKEEKEEIWNKKKLETPRWLFYKKSYKSKFKLKLEEAYWNNLFTDILQVLASENLLLETEKLISVKSAGNEDEDILE